MADASTNGPGATDRPLIAAQRRQTSAPTSFAERNPWGRWSTGSCLAPAASPRRPGV